MTFAIPSRRVAAIVVVCAAIARPAVAGPPLVVHPYNIGEAQSLPWSGREGRTDYDRSRVVDDTIEILKASPSVIVHAETLRRAVIYARQDTERLSLLISKLTERAAATEQSPRPDPLVLLDLGYVIEAVREMDLLNDMAFARAPNASQLVAGKDGYVFAVKAVSLRPDDAAMHFAASLLAAGQHPREVARHQQIARQGRSPDPLVAKNLDHLRH